MQTIVFYAFCAFKKNPRRKSRLKRDKEKERVRKGELALARSPPVEKPRDSRVAAHSPSGIFSRGISSRSNAKTNALTQTHYWLAFAHEEKELVERSPQKVRDVSVTPPTFSSRRSVPLSLSFVSERE